MEKLKSVTTYIVILFVVGIFAYLIAGFGEELEDNPNAQLSNSSRQYIDEMTGGNKTAGLNTSIYGDDIGRASELGGNDNKNEFSLDFSFGDKSGNALERTVYLIFNIPEFIFDDIFRIPLPTWIWDIIDWFFNIMLFVAFIIWIRKGD